MWSDLLKARPISIWKPITELPRKNPFFNQNQLDGIDTEVQPSFLKFKSTSASIILTQLSFIFLPRSQNCIFVKQIVQNTATLTQSSPVPACRPRAAPACRMFTRSRRWLLVTRACTPASPATWWGAPTPRPTCKWTPRPSSGPRFCEYYVIRHVSDVWQCLEWKIQQFELDTASF